ncbi:MAG TPA: 1-acyl-sn-glycerol-3-phosphate acyltransferase [Vicinamibacteria bacterium]|nr:1-acyl-sn-glycerol-3-phosphate acyltransferase [Vicinamibacteria bacterium]
MIASGAVKSWMRRRSWRSLRAVRREFRGRIDRNKRAGKAHVRRELLADPEVASAVAEHARSSGEDEAKAWARARSYVEEIVPGFNLISYYRLGHGLARLLIPLFYKVSVAYEARAALDAMPRDSVVLYLMNHRSNADYVVVAYVLSGRVALSYAVGEWARVWPLEAVFKSFGSYFVRRRYREPLYHKVLERYVQLITRNGVTQGIFLEGGLTRDGRFREPKLGLLDYLLRVKREPGFARPLHVVPVAINYDRVLEDRSLLREGQSEAERLRRREQIREVASYVLKVSGRFLLRRARRYGRACVNFGAPLDVDAWLEANPGVLDLPREERLPRVKELADAVMGRIAAVMPVTAVALAAAALLRHPDGELSRARWEALMDELRSTLRAARAPVIGEERSSAEILERALVMLTLRRVVEPQGDGFRVDRRQDPLLRYYANSIGHFFPEPAGPAA